MGKGFLVKYLIEVRKKKIGRKGFDLGREGKRVDVWVLWNILRGESINDVVTFKHK